jgi:hypothetical protein
MSYFSGVRNRLWSNERGSKGDTEKITPSDSLLISRLEDGYSFVTTGNTSKNIEISKKYKLGFIWSWLNNNDNFEGILQILSETKSQSKTRNSYTFYTSPNRNSVLSMLNWPELDRYKSSSLRDRSSYTPIRALLISLSNFDLPSSLEYLKELKHQEPVLYSVLKSFSFDNKSSISKFSGQLSYSFSSYVSAIFLFLSGNDLTKITEKLPFPDNVAFACIFLPDQQLKNVLRKLAETYRVAGDLNGVIISGFDTSGVETMEKFFENTEDIQTVALIAMTCRSLNLPRFQEWITAYKSRLNQLELWPFRAKLEMDERKVFRMQQDQYKTSRCCICQTPLTSQVQETEGWVEKDIGKKFINICENCPGSNNNLCCSVCLNPYQVLTVSQFDQERSEDWFVWCESCNHGGHAEHLAAWFQDFKTCPVVSCRCRCDLIA